MKHKVVFLLLLAAAFFPKVNAQSSHVLNLTIENGLSSNYVRTIYKDAQGFMWFGTDTGLDRFDGHHLINYSKRFKTALKGAVQSMVALGKGRLLVGTSWGAFLYDIHENRIVPIEFDSPSIDVRAVYSSSLGKTYFATDRGLFVLDTLSNTAKRKKQPGRDILALTDVTEDERGRLWLVGKEGLFKLNDQGTLESILTLPDCRVAKAYGRSLYIGSTGGLLVYDFLDNRIQRIKGLERISVLSLVMDHKGRLLVGSDNAGAFLLDAKTAHLSKFVPTPALASKSIFSMFCDPGGMLWIGTFDSGFHVLNLKERKLFRTIEFENSGNANLRSFYIAPNGDKYIGTRTGTLYCLDAANHLKWKTNKALERSFRSDILTTIHPYPGKSDVLLIGTFGGGVTVFNTKTKQCSDFSLEKTFQSGTIYQFCTDDRQHLWMASLDGLYRYDLVNGTLKRFDPIQTAGSSELFSLCYDGVDKIWLGTKTGACFFSVSRGSFFQPASCRSRRFQCTATYVDSKRNSWFCFNKGGVLKLDKNEKEVIWLDKEIGLPENAPSSLVDDRNGSIWIGSSKGLFRVKPNNEVHAFGLDDGLSGIGICPESATIDRHGNLWWSNEVGLVTYLNDSSMRSTMPSAIVLTRLTINGKPFDPDTMNVVTKDKSGAYQIDIKGKSNKNLEFEVAALDFPSFGRNQYSFLLEGVDPHWSLPGTDPVVAYNKLKPGSYVLKVKVSDHEGAWSRIPMEIKFSITPYFYETAWFVFFIGFLAIVLMLYFTRKYTQRIRLRIAKQLQEKERAGSYGMKLSVQKSREIKEALLKYMQDEKPWLNSGLRQADVAVALGYPVHEISQLLNVQMKQNFQDFVNSYRVEEIKRRIQQGDTQKYTLTAIAIQCGFSAKSSFQRAFKKATDTTPSDYLRNQGRNFTSDTNNPS